MALDLCLLCVSPGEALIAFHEGVEERPAHQPNYDGSSGICGSAGSGQVVITRVCLHKGRVRERSFVVH